MKNDEWYTPPEEYDRILGYVHELIPETRDAKILRPFYPGGNYQAEDYTDAIVIDNPPFSNEGKIIAWYLEHDVKFVLFAPALSGETCKINYIFFPNSCIRYSEGSLPTCLVTNLTECDIIYGGGDGKNYELSMPEFTAANAHIFANHSRQRRAFRTTKFYDSGKIRRYGVVFRVEEELS